jgi:hypothetical protein
VVDAVRVLEEDAAEVEEEGCDGHENRVAGQGSGVKRVGWRM